MSASAGYGAHLPTSTDLDIDAELWNAMSRRIIYRTAGWPDASPLLSTRDKAIRIAVMALDAAIDEWRAGYLARTGVSLNDGSRTP